MRLFYPTTWGRIEIAFNDDADITACTLPEPPAAACRPPFRVSNPSPLRWPPDVIGFLNACFSGERAPLPGLKMPRGTAFQQAVWRALATIPLGETRSYAAVASQVGHPGAARAVGQACGANPLPLFFPCHRVIAADGGVGGFSCGPAWKQLLLEIEQRTYSAASPASTSIS